MMETRKKVFVPCGEIPKTLERKRAFGYKNIEIADDVQFGTPVEFVTDGTTLRVQQLSEEPENNDEIYTIVCKEFGLIGMEKGYSAKVSIMHCDDGWMVVTLHDGGVVLNIDDSLVMPTVGKSYSGKINPDDIRWISQDELASYMRYLGIKGDFMYDFEFMLQLAGSVTGGCGNFRHRTFADEDIDISLGYVAQYEQKMQNRHQALEAKRLADSILNAKRSEEYAYDFEEEQAQEQQEDEDDEDDDYYDWNE